MVARGLRDREIADELGIAVRTVTTIMTRILVKLGAPGRDRTSAAAYAAAHGVCGSR
jgi:DNA-binding NarL/FixJ family response regulator